MNLLSSALLSGGSIIDLDGTLILQMGLFFVVLVVLRSLIFKPMVALFDARDAAIDGAKAQARELEAEADDAGSSFDEEMRRVRVAAAEERDRLRAEGHDLERNLIATVHEETSKQLAEAETQAMAAAEKVRKEMPAKAELLAKQIASKLLEREVQ